jgi:hypothetical protein
MKYFCSHCGHLILYSESQHFRTKQPPAPQVDSNAKAKCHRQVADRRILFSKAFVIQKFLSTLVFTLIMKMKTEFFCYPQF